MEILLGLAEIGVDLATELPQQRGVDAIAGPGDVTKNAHMHGDHGVITADAAARVGRLERDSSFKLRATSREVRVTAAAIPARQINATAKLQTSWFELSGARENSTACPDQVLACMRPYRRTVS